MTLDPRWESHCRRFLIARGEVQTARTYESAMLDALRVVPHMRRDDVIENVRVCDRALPLRRLRRSWATEREEDSVMPTARGKPARALEMEAAPVRFRTGAFDPWPDRGRKIMATQSNRQKAHEKVQRTAQREQEAVRDLLSAATDWDESDERAPERRALRDAVQAWRRAKSLSEQAERAFEAL